jgi:hypothetical protein
MSAICLSELSPRPGAKFRKLPKVKRRWLLSDLIQANGPLSVHLSDDKSGCAPFKTSADGGSVYSLGLSPSASFPFAPHHRICGCLRTVGQSRWLYHTESISIRSGEDDVLSHKAYAN